MAPKLLAETAGMIGVKELKDAFKEVRERSLPSSLNNPYEMVRELCKDNQHDTLTKKNFPDALPIQPYPVV